jgi:hypothetical protein
MKPQELQTGVTYKMVRPANEDRDEQVLELNYSGINPRAGIRRLHLPV